MIVRSGPTSARAFSLIELLIVASVISILFGLSLPAIQTAREAARKATCLSNLRQLAMAATQYHDTHGMTPCCYWRNPNKDPRLGGFGYFSVHSALLPFVEQSQVYDELNFNRGLPLVNVSTLDDWAEHHTVARLRIRLFVCPSDGRTVQWSGSNNYRGNWGTGPYWLKTAEYTDSANGLFCRPSIMSFYGLRFSSVTDGASKTAMWSERLVGSNDDRGGLRDVKEQVVTASPYTGEDWRKACAANDLVDAGVYPYSGRYWLFTGVHQTLYTHILPPNSRITDCQIFGAVPPWGAGTARSNHPGSVNVAMVDGSTRSIGDAIALKVWVAIGSRDGGEVVPDSTY